MIVSIDVDKPYNILPLIIFQYYLMIEHIKYFQSIEKLRVICALIKPLYEQISLLKTSLPNYFILSKPYILLALEVFPILLLKTKG